MEILQLVDLIVGVAFLSFVIFSFVFYIIHPSGVGEEERIKFEKDTKRAWAFYRNIYHLVGGWLYKIAHRLPLKGLDPDSISLVGLIFNISGAMLLIFGMFSFAGISAAIGGVLDIVDGKTARETGRKDKAGAFLDSVLDRISEIGIFAGITYVIIKKGEIIVSVVSLLAMGFSLLVSYARARAESLNIVSREGYMRRQERVFIITFSLIFDSIYSRFFGEILFLKIAVFVIFIGAVVTSGERIINIYKELRKRG